MPTAQEMIDVIGGHDRDSLVGLYDQISSGDTPPFWADGMAMEHLVLHAFRMEGVEVRWPYRVQMPESARTMEQIDGVLYVEGLSILVETKDTQEPQNIEPIAKLKSQLDRRPPQTLGLVMSRSGYTVPAITLTQLISGGRIMLWRGDELRYALAGSRLVRSLREKHRHLIEQAMPDLNVIPIGLFQPPDLLTGDPPNGPDAPG